MSDAAVLKVPHSDAPERQQPAAPSADVGQLALDIFATDDSIFVVAPVAGVDADNVDIEIKTDTLTISGARQRPAILPTAGESFVGECYWGKFSRSVLLPAAVNSADAVAKLERDIIIIQIPKARKAVQQKVRIISTQ